MNDRLRTALRQLRLSGLSDSLEVRLAEAQSHNLNHAEFLELILQDELAVRSDRLLQRRVKLACFRELKTLDDFDWSFNPAIKKKQIFDLASGQFIRQSRPWAEVVEFAAYLFCPAAAGVSIEGKVGIGLGGLGGLARMSIGHGVK